MDLKRGPNPDRARRALAVLLAAIFLGWITPRPARGQSTNWVLTNASQILALPSEHAYGRRVQIQGVVTAAQPDTEWGGRFFMQDDTAGVFVENVSTNQPKPGDLLEVTGISHPGGFAPIISSPRWHKLGSAPLPPAKAVPIEQLMAGIEDSQRVEITGIIRAFRRATVVIVFEIVSGGYRLDVNVPPAENINPQTLIGAKVRVRGTAATFFSGKLRHLITVSLHVPQPGDFIVERTEPGDPFAERVLPLDRLAQYRSVLELGRRVHVKGTVTYQHPGEVLFLQDATGGMRVQSRLSERVLPGEVVEAVGFPNFEQFLPVLQDAEFRRTAEPRRTPTTKPVTISELQGGFRHADMITIQGRVLDSMERPSGFQSGGQPGQRTILTLQFSNFQISNFLFSVEGPATRYADAGPISAPIGSLVEVNGVCLSEIAENGKLQSLHVLLPHPTSLHILQAPNWWTPKRLLLGLAGLFTVLIVALTWSVMVSRRNAALKISIHEKEQAQIGLQHANERLEERFKERSEQLKLQITARQESELQFKAVLHERTRLAQELHDTLEQSLTGIALQMDTAAKFATTEGKRASHHLELARNLVTQSQAEVRCSVWNLRSRSLDQMDLPALLVQITRQLTDDTGLDVEVTARGRVRPLPELIEENLLRVGQEALTNIIKHSQATKATMALDYGPKFVRLHIQDNGSGFVLANHAGPREGHFGLLGISERTKRLQGEVNITSVPGAGTTLQVTIPIEPPPTAGSADSPP